MWHFVSLAGPEAGGRGLYCRLSGHWDRDGRSEMGALQAGSSEEKIKVGSYQHCQRNHCPDRPKNTQSFPMTSWPNCPIKVRNNSAVCWQAHDLMGNEITPSVGELDKYHQTEAIPQAAVLLAKNTCNKTTDTKDFIGTAVKHRWLQIWPHSILLHSALYACSLRSKKRKEYERYSWFIWICKEPISLEWLDVARGQIIVLH